VQIPCIERTAQAEVKATEATQITPSGDGERLVSLTWRSAPCARLAVT